AARRSATSANSRASSFRSAVTITMSPIGDGMVSVRKFGAIRCRPTCLPIAGLQRFEICGDTSPSTCKGTAAKVEVHLKSKPQALCRNEGLGNPYTLTRLKIQDAGQYATEDEHGGFKYRIFGRIAETSVYVVQGDAKSLSVSIKLDR